MELAGVVALRVMHPHGMVALLPDAEAYCACVFPDVIAQVMQNLPGTLLWFCFPAPQPLIIPENGGIDGP